MTSNANLDRAFQEGIFWITNRIAVGRFASEQRCERLIDYGVTHVLNVSEAQSTSAAFASFQQVVDVPLNDAIRIPQDKALRCVEMIHEVTCNPETKLYVHCVAGQIRSPTVLWLYLLACGLDAGVASRRIVERSPSSMPGYEGLIDNELINAVVSLGRSKRMKPVRFCKAT